MKGSKRPAWLLTAAAAALIVLVVPSTAGASHSWGSSGGPYHWARTSNPFTLKVGDNVSSAWDAHLATARADWSASSVLDLSVVAGSTKPRTCKPTSGRVQVCSERYGYNGWLGIAQIWISGSHITQGTVKVNDTYFATSTYNTPAWRRFVMCQEIGHTLGLDHQNENFGDPNLGSCMDYTSDPDGPPSNEHPNAHDYEQLAAIYSHVDSTTTVASAEPSGGGGPGGGNGKPAEPGDWGRRVAGSDSPQSVARYERDLGNGDQLITFVIWA